jgi:hypothetical protein
VTSFFDDRGQRQHIHRHHRHVPERRLPEPGPSVWPSSNALIQHALIKAMAKRLDCGGAPSPACAAQLTVHGALAPPRPSRPQRSHAKVPTTNESPPSFKPSSICGRRLGKPTAGHRRLILRRRGMSFAAASTGSKSPENEKPVDATPERRGCCSPATSTGPKSSPGVSSRRSSSRWSVRGCPSPGVPSRR